MKQVIWSFISSFSTKGLLFLFSLVLGNILAPHDMGVFVSLMMFLLYAQMFFSYQIGPAIVHKINVQASREDQDIYFSAGLMLTLLTAVIAVIATFGFQVQILEMLNLLDNEMLVLLMVPLLLMRMLRDYFQRVLQSKNQFKRIAIINLLATTIQLGVAIVLLSMGFGLYGVVAALYLANIIAVVVSVFYVFQQFKWHWRLESGGKASKDIIKFSGYIYIAAIVVLLDTKIDIFLVNYYLKKEDLALYAYAIEFALVFVLIGEALSQVNYPKLSKAFSQNMIDHVRTIYEQSLMVSFYMVSVSAMVFALFAEEIISFVLPDFYLRMIPSLGVLLIGIIPFAVMASVGSMMTSKGVPLYDAIPVSISLVVNVILSIILIPKYGILGAAVSTSVSFQLRALLGVYMIQNKTGIRMSYVKMILVYLLFVLLVICGSYYVDSNVFDLFAIIFYSVIGWFVVLGRNLRKRIGGYFLMMCNEFRRFLGLSSQH